MKTQRKLVLATLLSMVIIFSSSVSQISTTTTIVEPKRAEIVWTTGHWAAPTAWNPLYWGPEAWGGFIMYQPLFEYNYVKGELMPILGKNMKWSSDGSELEIALHPEAEWSDGTQVTFDDVNYTMWWRLQTNLGWVNDSNYPRIESFEKINASGIRVNLNSDFKFSRAVWDQMMRVRIVPKHVWEEILADPDYGNGDIWAIGDWAFTNDWLDGDFPEDWKVASGPYHPYFVDDLLTKEIYVRDDDWWGNDVLITGKPEAMYIGQLHYSTNVGQNQALEADQIDWFGGYYPRIWELMDKNEYITTWTLGEEPYFPGLSGMVELVPNHMRYPFVEPWLRQAMAHALDYDGMSLAAASGYLVRARQGYLDDRSPVQEHVYNASIQEEYGIDQDVAKAKEILDEHCFVHTDGQWYTDDVPTKYRTMTGAVDALDDVTGINVLIGGWGIMTVNGWSDSMMQSMIMADNLGDIGIAASADFIDYGTYEADFQAMNFDLMNFCMGFAPLNDLYVGLRKFTGVGGAWANFSAWNNQEYVDLLDDLEVAEAGSEEEKRICSELQEILASVMPSIPVSPNGYWYTMNYKYWEGFPHIDDPWMQICAPWATDYPGGMQIILTNLKKSTGPPPKAKAAGPSPWNFESVILAVTSSAVLLSILRKRKKIPKVKK